MSWSGGLIAFALLFGLFLWWREGAQHALEYYTGYLIELSLSVDNLFVFILIFSYFGVPAEAQPKVLKWGILGAIVMRLIMIALGALLLAAVPVDHLRLRRDPDPHRHPDAAPEGRADRAGEEPGRPAGAAVPAVLRQLRRRQLLHAGPARGRLLATPLLLVLLVVEWSDLVFAIDSIPAIFAITRDPFLVYSSNVFAILGLRALFFVLAGMHGPVRLPEARRGADPGLRRREDGGERLAARAHPGEPRGHHPRPSARRWACRSGGARREARQAA